MSQEERDRLEWLKRAKDGVISQREAARRMGVEVDPIFWTKKERFLDGGGALKMKERQCPQPVRIIRPA